MSIWKRWTLLVSILLLTMFHPFIIMEVMSISNNEPTPSISTEKVYFAGGCFWCMEPVFDVIPGVVSTISGYMGGSAEDANYNAVSAGITKHIETIQVEYDPEKVDYRTLVDAFWRSIDPTDETGQFADKGYQYQTAIFIRTEEQRVIATASKDFLIEINKFEDPIVTKFLPETTFYEAEEYHQNYYIKHTVRYNSYKIGSGRAGFLKKVWGYTGN